MTNEQWTQEDIDADLLAEQEEDSPYCQCNLWADEEEVASNKCSSCGKELQ